MGTVTEILEAYRKLSAEEQSAFLAEIQRTDDQWDKQIEADTKAGKLDFLRQQALSAEKNGQLKDLRA